VADQEFGRTKMARKILSGSLEVLHIRGEVAVGELPARGPEAGEVEPQNGDAPIGEFRRDPPGDEEVFRASETMGEDCVGSDWAKREFEPGGERITA
jgi:hypothetical protein